MIFGIGTDIIEIDRIEKKLNDEKFLNRVYTQRELAYIHTKGNKAQTAAGIFCAKEAVLKALSQGITKIGSIEILTQTSGAPFVVLHGNLAGDFLIHVSISHAKMYAVAQAVIEKNEK
ncbi:MAG: holo-ACP synthase [Christensenellaceae bacterium]